MRLASILGMGLFLCAAPGLAQSPPQVQITTGFLDRGALKVYDLDLKKGDTLYVYMARVSRNLDPVAAVAGTNLDLKSFNARLKSVRQLSPERYFQAFRDLLDSHFLAWNDDGGRGSDAALKFAIPADGHYRLVVTGEREDSRLQAKVLTFGDYRLLIGINAPQVLSGRGTPTGQVIARRERSGKLRIRIQEIKGVLTPQHKSTYFRLRNIDPGAVLYARVQTTAGNLKPALVLRNYGGKIIQAALPGSRDAAQLKYAFTEESRNYSLRLMATRQGQRQTSGSYRLLLGLDAPEVLTGKGKPVGLPLIKEPIRVRVGMFVEQISKVNQKDENFEAVGDLVLEWNDPAYAFNPDSCQCIDKIYTPTEFEKFVLRKGLYWPRFVFFNQQGKRWSQGENFKVYNSGEVVFYERFSGTFQAPDFDFRKFPFDTQKFFIRLESWRPEEDYVFTFLPQYTGLGKDLGEEEWYILKHGPQVSSTVWADGSVFSQYSFMLLARRHLSYYIFRIFIPLLLIIIVSYVSFFLEDFSKRVDISGANLLVFIAFNFTIGSDLPRLGYLTFLDTVLIVAFIVTALTVIFNVILKRLDTLGKTELTQRIDSYILWGYPLFYVVGLALLFLIFFH